jgi:F-type H+-transporting ATPase subunit b
MQFDWWTLALQTVNFLILVWLLHRFLYKPVLGIVDARRAEIDAQYADARKVEAKAQAELSEIESERAGIVSERVAALKTAAGEAEAASTARRAKAEAEAAALLDQTRKSLAKERTAAVIEARRSASDLALTIAQKLLEQFPAKLRAEAWLSRIEEYLADLSPDQRVDIAGQADGGGRLRIVSAVALPDSVKAKWRDSLYRKFHAGLPIDFNVDPELIAGVELHFPHALLRFSWRSVIDSMQTEIEGREDAR